MPTLEVVNNISILIFDMYLCFIFLITSLILDVVYLCFLSFFSTYFLELLLINFNFCFAFKLIPAFIIRSSTSLF